jgi:hypothetical protein
MVALFAQQMMGAEADAACGAVAQFSYSYGQVASNGM